MSRFAIRSGAMFTAASVMNSVCAWVGTSMTKTWLMRRPVPQTAFSFRDGRQQLVGVQAALHNELGPARAHQLDGLLGRRDAVRDVDDLEIADVDPAFTGHS